MMMERVVAKVRMGEPVPLQWSGLDWYVAAVDHGRDGEAREWLEGKSIPVFMVEGCKPYRHRTGGEWRKRYWLPFEGYLFVGDLTRVQRAISGWHVDRHRRAIECPVYGLLGADAKPSRVNGFAMQALFAAHDAGWFTGTKRRRIDGVIPFKVGESVAVNVGPWASVDALIKAFKGEDRVEIKLQLFGIEHLTTVGLDSISKKG